MRKRYSNITSICILLIGLGFGFGACTRIPVQSIALSEQIQAEGSRMHQLNLILIQQLFATKKARVADFIKQEYTPHFIQQMTEDISDEASIKSELPQILAAAIPVISERQYAMQMALDSAKTIIIAQLNDDYAQYNLANQEMKKLLTSAIKLNERKQALLNQSTFFKRKGINYQQLSDALDRFVLSSGNVGGLVVNLKKDIQQIFN